MSYLIDNIQAASIIFPRFSPQNPLATPHDFPRKRSDVSRSDPWILQVLAIQWSFWTNTKSNNDMALALRRVACRDEISI